MLHTPLMREIVLLGDVFQDADAFGGVDIFSLVSSQRVFVKAVIDHLEHSTVTAYSNIPGIVIPLFVKHWFGKPEPEIALFIV